MKLTDLKQLCDAATPGPWTFVSHENYSEVVAPKTTSSDWANPTICDSFDYYPSAVSDENQRFIAAARTYLPKLIEIAEAAQSLLSEDGAKAAVSQYVALQILEDRVAELESD